MKQLICLILNLFLAECLSAQAVFRHVTAAANTSGHITTLDHAQLNGNPKAMVFVTTNWGTGGAGIDYGNNVGVWYNGSRWTIFNQNTKLPMPPGVTFNVMTVPEGTPGVFRHTVTAATKEANGFNNGSQISHPSIDGKDGVIIMATQCWTGTYNDNPIQMGNRGGCGLGGTVKWTIANGSAKADGSDYSNFPMPVGASFNIMAIENGKVPGFSTANAYTHVAKPETIIPAGQHISFFDHPELNGKPDAMVFVTPFWGRGTICTDGPDVLSPTSVWYDHPQDAWKYKEGYWSVYYGKAGIPMPNGAKFNVVVVPNTINYNIPQSFDNSYTLLLNKRIYQSGNGVSVKLTMPSHLSFENDFVVLSSTRSKDVESVRLRKTTIAGVYETASTLPVRTTNGASVPKPGDGTLTLEPGEMFSAMYFPKAAANMGDKSNTPDLVYDVAMFEELATIPKNVKTMPELALSKDELTPKDKNAKPCGTVLAQGGYPIQMAVDELILMPTNKEQLERFLQKTGGQVLSQYNASQTNAIQYLVKVKTNNVNPNNLSQLRAAWGLTNQLVVSNEATARLLTLTLECLMEGYPTMPNVRLFSDLEDNPVTYSTPLNNPLNLFTAGASGDNLSAGFTDSHFNIPKVWSLMALFDFDERSVPVGFIDQGFSPNADFRTGFQECDLALLQRNAPIATACGRGSATAVPTVGNSLTGPPSWHGNGVVSVAGAMINNRFGVGGTGGQVVVPHLYRMDLAAYIFEVGLGIRVATDRGASVINVSAGYPCRIVTNILGWSPGICSPLDRAGFCALVTATLSASLGAACGALGAIPFAGPFLAAACAISAVATLGAVTTACAVLFLPFDARAAMEDGVRYALSRGVTVIASTGNLMDRASFTGVPAPLLDLFNFDRASMTTEQWQPIPAVIPGVICVSAADPSPASNFANLHVFGSRADIWAPILSNFFAPNNTTSVSATQVLNPTGRPFGGTSAAAPYIAGLIANAKAIDPSLPPSALRDLLVSTGYTNAELRAEGIGNPNNERGVLVNPFRFVSRVARRVLPDFASRGYNFEFNNDENGSLDDDPATTTRIVDATRPPAELSGAIVTFPAASSSALAIRDVDCYKWRTGSVAGSYRNGFVELIYPTAFGNLSINNDMVPPINTRTSGDETIKRYAIPSFGANTTFDICVNGVGNQDNIYKLRFGAALYDARADFGSGLPWEMVGSNPNIIDIAASGSRLYALHRDLSLWESESGRDGTWRRIAERLDNAEDITVTGCHITFQKNSNREVWALVPSGGAPYRVGTPWGAREISGIGGICWNEFPVETMFALNDDRTFWINEARGLDEYWTQVAHLGSTRKIAAVGYHGNNCVFALNDDNTLWMHLSSARDDRFWQQKATEMTNIREITAANIGSQACIFALRTDGTIWKACLSLPLPTTTMVQIPDVVERCPSNHVGGDQEFAGNGPDITCTSSFAPSFDGTRVENVLSFRAAENPRGDGSEVRDEWRSVVFTAPDNMRISGAGGYGTANFRSRAAGGEAWPFCNEGQVHDSESGQIPLTGGVFQRVIIVGDTGGKDIKDNCGCDTKIKLIRYRPFQVQLVPR